MSGDEQQAHSMSCGDFVPISHWETGPPVLPFDPEHWIPPALCRGQGCQPAGEGGWVETWEAPNSVGQCREETWW